MFVRPRRGGQASSGHRQEPGPKHSENSRRPAGQHHEDVPGHVQGGVDALRVRQGREGGVQEEGQECGPLHASRSGPCAEVGLRLGRVRLCE